MIPAGLQAKIGQHIGTSDWYIIDQSRIDSFAECAEDHQFIHTDPVAASRTFFGQTIAHGFLTLSMLASMLDSLFQTQFGAVVNYGLNEVRFTAPVKSGRRIRGHFKLIDLVERRAGQWQQTVEVTVEIEGEGKPALSPNGYFSASASFACEENSTHPPAGGTGDMARAHRRLVAMAL